MMFLVDNGVFGMRHPLTPSTFVEGEKTNLSSLKTLYAALNLTVGVRAVPRSDDVPHKQYNNGKKDHRLY